MVPIPSNNAAGWKGVTKTNKVYQFKYKQNAVAPAISIKTATPAQVQPPFECCYIQLLHSTALCAATSLLTCVRTCLLLATHRMLPTACYPQMLPSSPLPLCCNIFAATSLLTCVSVRCVCCVRRRSRKVRACACDALRMDGS